MWKRLRYEINPVPQAEKVDTKRRSVAPPMPNGGGPILDTEAGLVVAKDDTHHSDSQHKHRPGSFAHYAGVTCAMICLYLMFISSLPSPDPSAGASGGHPLPKWIHYFLDSQAAATPPMEVTPELRPEVVLSPAPVAEAAVLPPTPELPSSKSAELPSEASAVAVAPAAAAVAVDKCAGVKWRPDQLVGKCFGLEAAPVPEASTSWEACRDHCCEAKEACVTWQYQKIRGCVVGGGVRLGLEKAAPSAWCEETSPEQIWQGRRLTSREAVSPPSGDKTAATAAAGSAAAATCAWSTEELPYQCFGLGPERVDESAKDSATKGRLSLAECQQWCCDHDACQTWQWRADKGCFGGKEGHCEMDNEPYVGGRKCVEGSC